MTRLSTTRMSFAALMALVGVFTLMAAPAAYAGKPERTVDGAGTFFIPAGEGCAFDVLWVGDAHARITTFQFDDGRLVTVTNGTPTLINLDTGTTFVHHAKYHLVETYDAATNEYTDTVNGSYVLQFYPGDAGPSGVMTEPVMYRFTGWFRVTADADTFAYSSFTYEGTFTDICAALAG